LSCQSIWLNSRHIFTPAFSLPVQIIPGNRIGLHCDDLVTMALVGVADRFAFGFWSIKFQFGGEAVDR
jgi:hypothetical protein